jgi:hypothetical protein
MTALDLIKEALAEINAIQAGNAPSPELSAIGLSKLKQVVNNWNADRPFAYADDFLSFTLTPSLSPHTIGPTGATWTVTQRPVSIEGIALVLNTGGTPYSYVGLTPRDAEWWQNQTTPALTSTMPSDFYYDPTAVNGKIYFWPVPTVAYPVQLHVRSVLDDQLALATTLILPPGYHNALMLTTAEDLSDPLRKMWTPKQQMKAQQARARIQKNNHFPTRLKTQDAGMPSGRHSRAGIYNWRTGQPFPD